MVRHNAAHMAYSRPIRLEDEKEDNIDVYNPKRIDDKWFKISNLQQSDRLYIALMNKYQKEIFNIDKLKSYKSNRK